jgi:dTDP-4-dehydrorhamnose reductase
MLRLAAERDELKVIDDQIGAPTGAELLADVTAHAARRLQADPALAGTYHCVAGGETSWHGYARFVIEWARAHGQAIKRRARRHPPDSHQRVPDAGAKAAELAPVDPEAAAGLRSALAAVATGVERMLTEVLGL